MFFNIKEESKKIKLILSDENLMKKEFKEIKNTLLNINLDKDQIFSFVKILLKEKKDLVFKYQNGDKKIFGIFIQEIKKEFQNINLNKEIIDKLKDLLENYI